MLDRHVRKHPGVLELAPLSDRPGGRCVLAGPPAQLRREGTPRKPLHPPVDADPSNAGTTAPPA